MSIVAYLQKTKRGWALQIRKNNQRKCRPNACLAKCLTYNPVQVLVPPPFQTTTTKKEAASQAWILFHMEKNHRFMAPMKC